MPSSSNSSVEICVLICDTCRTQVANLEPMDADHWRCLNDSMWSQIPAVQVMVWYSLTRLREAGWLVNLLDMLYLDEDSLVWANATGETDSHDDMIKHLESNGTVLEAGDTCYLEQRFKCERRCFSAKRGTAVRNISLVADNSGHIEGRVNGQQIVILTKFTKKSN